MPGAEFYTAASSRRRATGSLAGAYVVGRARDRRARGPRARRAAARSSARPSACGELSPVATTRLRLVRRLVFAMIIVIGIGAGAAAQIPAVSRLATGILASSAVLGLVVGFAARQTLANGIAGHPARDHPADPDRRPGDLRGARPARSRTCGSPTPTSASTTAAAWSCRTSGWRRARSQNHTIVDPRVQVEVSVWLPPDADLDRAHRADRGRGGRCQRGVAEVDKEGVRLSATTWADSAGERGAAAAELRRRWLRLLREHGLSSVEAS